MIIGTFTLQSAPLFALIDSRSTHSYILRDLVGELGILIETTRMGITVSSPLG